MKNLFDDNLDDFPVGLRKLAKVVLNKHLVKDDGKINLEYTLAILDEIEIGEIRDSEDPYEILYRNIAEVFDDSYWSIYTLRNINIKSDCFENLFILGEKLCETLPSLFNELISEKSSNATYYISKFSRFNRGIIALADIVSILLDSSYIWKKLFSIEVKSPSSDKNSLEIKDEFVLKSRIHDKYRFYKTVEYLQDDCLSMRFFDNDKTGSLCLNRTKMMMYNPIFASQESFEKTMDKIKSQLEARDYNKAISSRFLEVGELKLCSLEYFLYVNAKITDFVKNSNKLFSSEDDNFAWKYDVTEPLKTSNEVVLNHIDKCIKGRDMTLGYNHYDYSSHLKDVEWLRAIIAPAFISWIESIELDGVDQ